MQYKVIIFDMDGVLFDSIPNAIANTFVGYPEMTREQYDELHTGNYHAELAKYSHLKKKESAEDEARRRADYSERKAKTPLFPGINQLLHTLHDQGLKIALNTSAFNKNCIPLLDNSGITDLFDFIGTAEISKDKTEKFLHIIEKFGAQKEETIFVTDALGDLRDADKAGIPTVAVTWGVHDETFFNRERHDNLVGIFHDVDTLKKFLLK